MYEYQCASCGDTTDYLVGVGSDAPDLACESCGSEKLQRVISLISVNRGAAPESCCGGMCERPTQASEGCACSRPL